MGKYYNDSIIPDSLRRNFNVYERIEELGIDLGSWDDNVGDLTGVGLAQIVFTESGLVYLSGTTKGSSPLNETQGAIEKAQKAASDAADEHIMRLHWALICGGEGGDLNDVLYTCKALGMIVSPGGGEFYRSPEVMNGYSFRWHSVFGGGAGDYAKNGKDSGGFSGVHARSAIGGFDGNFSIEPEIIVAIPSELAKKIIMNRGWIFPLSPAMHKNISNNKL